MFDESQQRLMCVECGGSLQFCDQGSNYTKPEFVCINCGICPNTLLEPPSPKDLSFEDRIVLLGDIKKLEARKRTKDIGRLGGQPLNSQIVQSILKDRNTQHIKKIVQEIRIKYSRCRSCGCLVQYKTRKPKYCKVCRRRKRTKYMRDYQRQRRSKL
jgi:hypothetical protein